MSKKEFSLKAGTKLYTVDALSTSTHFYPTIENAIVTTIARDYEKLGKNFIDGVKQIPLYTYEITRPMVLSKSTKSDLRVLIYWNKINMILKAPTGNPSFINFDDLYQFKFILPNYINDIKLVSMGFIDLNAVFLDSANITERNVNEFVAKLKSKIRKNINRYFHFERPETEYQNIPNYVIYTMIKNLKLKDIAQLCNTNSSITRKCNDGTIYRRYIEESMPRFGDIKLDNSVNYKTPYISVLVKEDYDVLEKEGVSPKEFLDLYLKLNGILRKTVMLRGWVRGIDDMISKDMEYSNVEKSRIFKSPMGAFGQKMYIFAREKDLTPQDLNSSNRYVLQTTGKYAEDSTLSYFNPPDVKTITLPYFGLNYSPFIDLLRRIVLDYRHYYLYIT